MNQYYYQMQNLEGVKGGRRKGEFFSSATKAFAIIQAGRVASAAGDNGSLVVYLNDNDQYHCEFSRYFCTQGKELLTSQRAVRKWLKQWYPRLHP